MFAGFVGAGWEASQLAGLIGLLLCIGLCGAPVRARDASPPTLLTLRAHTVLGWAAVGAVALHIGGLLLADRGVLEYLKPSMPIYMAAGVLAALLLLLVVTSATLPLKRTLWSTPRAFQAHHVIAGCLLLCLAAAHVLATSRYTGGPGRAALLLGAAAGAMLMLLRSRRRGELADAAADAERRLVFGRRSASVAGAVGLTACGLVAAMVGAAGTALREPLLAGNNSLPLDFPHGRHVQVNCLKCHHNYADGKGFENCILCHKSARNDLKAGVQARFHAFCFECHRHPDAGSPRLGPVAGCAGCHRPTAGVAPGRSEPSQPGGV